MQLFTFFDNQLMETISLQTAEAAGSRTYP